MEQAIKDYYRKRGKILIDHLRKRKFGAYYCDTKEEALKKALEIISDGSTICWGGAMSARQIGLMDAVYQGNFCPVDRMPMETQDEKDRKKLAAFTADYFISGANALSIDGQMVNIDGSGNRVSSIIYGPKHVIVIAGMNKVTDTLEQAVLRARTVAAPMNQQRFQGDTPCTLTGQCGNCISDDCICNQIVITRHDRIPGRIQFIIVGENLGL